MSRQRHGFSLIEALVALSIAAMTLTAIFELQTQMVRAQQRASQGLDEVAAQENAIALVRDLNPMAEPQGSVKLPDGDTIRWTAEPQGTPRINGGFPIGDGRYEVQLFTVTVTVQRDGARQPAALVLDRVGWRELALPVTGD